MIIKYSSALRNGLSLIKLDKSILHAAIFRCKRAMCSQAPSVQSEVWEEERLPFYRPEQFYPVHIGELLNSKYRVVGKLGYGAYSTVWLCHEKGCALAFSFRDDDQY